MTFDPTKPVQTRDGRPARIICTDRKSAPGRPGLPIVALVTLPEGNEEFRTYNLDGRFAYSYTTGQRPHDLINIPEPPPKTPTLDLTKPVQRSDGRPARIVATDAQRTDYRGNYPLLVLVRNKEGVEFPEFYALDGRGCNTYPSFTLVNAPQEQTRWVNIYEGYEGRFWPTKELADDNAHTTQDRIACIPVTFKPGDGL